jgi:hypothetical protein
MARYGRILFYDTRDGEVLLDTGQVEGDVLPITPEIFYRQLEDKFGSRNNIDHKQLEWNEDIDKFGKYSHVRVCPDGSLFFSTKETKYRIGIKSCQTDRWWPLFEKVYNIYDEEAKTFNEQKLKKFYDDFINVNLKNVCRTVNTFWLFPTQISRFNDSNEDALVHWNTDIFPSKEEFAKEMLESGMIFPCQVRVRDDKYLIFDGSHRIIAIKTLVKEGIWPQNRRVLALQFDTTNVNYVEIPDINYTMEKSIIMHIPKSAFPKYHFLKFVSQREFDQDIMEVEVDRYLDMVLLLRMYVTEMTRSMAKYKEITGKVFPPARAINDEEYYYQWIKEGV